MRLYVKKGSRLQKREVALKKNLKKRKKFKEKKRQKIWQYSPIDG